MSRSIYKPIYVHKALFEDRLLNREKNSINKNDVILNEKQKNIPRFLYFWTKNSLINLNLLDKKISIYNGKVFISLNVIKKITGYKLGSFCVTRKKPPHIGKQKQNKKVSRSHEKLVAERRRIINRGKTKSKFNKK